MIKPWDVCALAGMIMIVAGVAAIYWPLALILTGVFHVAVALSWEQKAKKRQDELTER